VLLGRDVLIADHDDQEMFEGFHDFGEDFLVERPGNVHAGEFGAGGTGERLHANFFKFGHGAPGDDCPLGPANGFTSCSGHKNLLRIFAMPTLDTLARIMLYCQQHFIFANLQRKGTGQHFRHLSNTGGRG
jgi:hypothetical protein